MMSPRLFLVLALLALAAAPAAGSHAAATDDGVRHALEVEPVPTQDVRVDGHAVFEVRVRNLGDATAHVEVQPAMPDWMSDRVEPTDAMPIAPGATRAYAVNLTVHGWAPNGTFALRVHAQLVERLAASAHVDVLFHVREPADARPSGGMRGDLPAGPVPLRTHLLYAQAGEEEPLWAWADARVHLLFANPTEAPVSLSFAGAFRASMVDPTLPRIDVEPAEVVVAPGATAVVEVRLQPSGDVPVGSVRQVLVPVDFGDGTHTAVGIAVRYVDPPPSVNATRLVVLGVPVTALAVAVAVLRRREDVWWKVLAPFAPLFTRLSRAKVLDHATRDRILALVRARPGLFWHEIKATTKLPTGVLVHHLRTLERHGFVNAQRLGRRLRFFPAGARAPPAEPVPTAGQARILGALETGARTQREIVELTGLTQQGVSYHLRNLERGGRIVLRDGPGGERRYARVFEMRTVEAPDRAQTGDAFK